MITRENYEAFYLDFIEGNLSPEMEAAFVAFLEANPDLQLEDESFPVLETEDELLGFTEKQLLKKSDVLGPVSQETIQFYLIAEVEGLLTAEQKNRLNEWILEHPTYAIEQRLYQQTVATPLAVSYPNKADLKQQTRIIPLWLSVSSAAASVALLIGLGMYNQGNHIDVTAPQLDQFAWKKPYTEVPVNGDSAHNTVAPQWVNGKAVFAKNPNKEDQKQEQPNPNSDMADDQAPSPKTNHNGSLLPQMPEQQPLAHHHVTEHPELHQASAHNDGNYVAWQGMTNPIEPITSTISNKLNTPIDFRRQKETEDHKKGFYLRIGKFEFMHKEGGRK